MFELMRSLLRPAVFRLAEIKANRAVSHKVRYLRNYYKQTNEQRCRQDKAQLQYMLQYAVENVPYYAKVISRDLIEKIGRDLNYYQDLPLLHKDIVNEVGDQLLSTKIDHRNLKKMKTGGSTGPSAYFYYDQDAADWSSATTWHCRAQYESMFHNQQLHFACDFGEMPQSPFRTVRALGEYLATNRVNIFTFDFSEQQVEYYLAQLQEKKPNIVHGHPSTLYAIANQAKRSGRSYKGIFNYFESSGETIYDYQKMLITEVFGCSVINRYGLAEAGVVAYQTKNAGATLQVMTHLVYPDPINAVGEQEFVFTTLRNFAMPLIRYNSRDVVAIGEHYSQSEGFFFESIQGRIHDFIDIGGRRIPTHAMMDVIDHRVGGVQEFQLLKNKTNSNLVLRVVPSSHAFDSVQASEKLAKYLGVPIALEVVSSADLIRGGYRNKFRHIVEVD